VVVVLVLITIAGFLTVDYFIRRRERERALVLVSSGAVAETGRSSDPTERLWGDSTGLLHVPAGTYLAPGHTWARPEPEGLLRLGCGRLPLQALGGVDQLQLRAPGSKIRVGDPIATLRRGKRQLSLRSPVEGILANVNTALQGEPARLSAASFDAGWLYDIRPMNLAAALRRMSVAEEARDWMRQEVARLRNLIARLTPSEVKPVPVLLDGGVPLEGFAERLSDEQWKALVDRFFETLPTVEGRNRGD
jgi:glycine cleavage system H lipoate-binding protein